MPIDPASQHPSSSSQPPEPIPPWHGHPDRRPEDWLEARQGLQQRWLEQVWEPFWAGLDEAQQADYLLRWEAPPVWRQALTQPSIALTGKALEDDLAESARWLRERAAASPTWWQRLRAWAGRR